jgi:hypothetical protein
MRDFHDMTIADLVQQVLYTIYDVRLDVDQAVDGAWHSKTDKFREIVMAANQVIQSLQQQTDWNWLRDRWEMGIAHNLHRRDIQEFTIPKDVYKICNGYNDAVRLHTRTRRIIEIPFVSPRSGNHAEVRAFDGYGGMNTRDRNVRAFVIGDTLTFTRQWFAYELESLVETDVIRWMEPLHICDASCPDPCPKAYEERILKEVPDPLYVVLATAQARVEGGGDPSVMNKTQTLTSRVAKVLSSMRENDSAHNTTDFYQTEDLGYIGVL